MRIENLGRPGFDECRYGLVVANPIAGCDPAVGASAVKGQLNLNVGSHEN